MYNIKRLYLMMGMTIVFAVVLSVLLAALFGGSENKRTVIAKYSDVRVVTGSFAGEDALKYDFSKMGNVREIVKTLRFNTSTVWPDNMPQEANPEEIMENAKGKGPGITKLHEKGYDGAGVNVGMIAPPIYIDHPEYSEAVAAYKVFGESKVEGSVIGTAVLSILAGKHTGIAPGAKVYYAAASVDSKDVIHYVDAIDWFIELNKTQLKDNPIRFVSVPADPDGADTPFDYNTDKWQPAIEKAGEEGIVIVDCSDRYRPGSCWGEGEDLSDIGSYKPGFPGSPGEETQDKRLLVPTGPFTFAAEYTEGEYEYEYLLRGGITWTAPYVTGVMVLGSQKGGAPKTAYEELCSTAYSYEDGPLHYSIIDPVNYISSIKKTP